MDIIELISIYLATGGEVVLDSMCAAPIVFYDIGRHIVTQHITCCIMRNLSYDIILGRIH